MPKDVVFFLDGPAHGQMLSIERGLIEYEVPYLPNSNSGWEIGETPDPAQPLVRIKRARYHRHVVRRLDTDLPDIVLFVYTGG
jgi:hypothetical protein